MTRIGTLQQPNGMKPHASRPSSVARYDIAGLLLLTCACSSDPGGASDAVGTGGSSFGVGGSSLGAGGSSVAGGATAASGGATSPGGGGTRAGDGGRIGQSGTGPTAGATSSAGGFSGMPSAGGASSGGAISAGGAIASGGAGPGNGGASGSSGAAGNGNGNGGVGGSGGGGSGACDFSDPPSNVAQWIDQSWDGQLGNNVKTRKAWNLDNVMLDKGQMHLCVRWGASSAVPDTVRMNLAATIERWFNDWFKGLGSYGCFPYGNGIKVSITGWAVRPGKESLLAGVGASEKIYTETDSDGEPKCPDACSSFVHWDHQFSSCPGGAANHSDYWLWFDDNLPGGGGAAAVGGDWGLRMPVSTFVNAFNQQSYLVVEHEMGHGFGFQDYYDWTGARPTGGSIMIVGSTSGSQAPTTGDIWLLRRTWKEMKTLRNW